jgi:hypothetical protein
MRTKSGFISRMTNHVPVMPSLPFLRRGIAHGAEILFLVKRERV